MLGDALQVKDDALSQKTIRCRRKGDLVNIVRRPCPQSPQPDALQEAQSAAA
jgi:hypothetical protein